MRQHPLSAAFPSMPESEFRELILDIEQHGLRHPIILFDGMILDGWHRYQACQEAGVKPKFEDLGPIDPVAYVISSNMHRRHLTGSQRAAAVVACAEWAPEGRPAKNPEPGSGLMTESDMAKAADVSDRTIRNAKRAHEAGLGEAVKEGKVTAKEAAQVAKLPEDQRQAALEAPKAPKAKPEPHEDVEALKARIAELEAKNAELADQLAEMTDLLAGQQEELEAARRTLDAEDILAQFKSEIVRAQEMARVTQSRNNGLMNENADLTHRLKSALRKIKSLETPKGEAA